MIDRAGRNDDEAAEAPAAYPRYIVEDDRPTSEPPLSRNFFEKNLSHLIGRRTAGGVWPDDPADPEAVKQFQAGQRALYEEKDVVLAIRCYEAALDRDSGYIKAWVALAIAYISDNTPESLERAEGVLTYLSGIEPNEWLTSEASSIIYQNLAYLYVHQYRQSGEKAILAKADANYAVADARAGDRPRIEFLCPWAYVKIEMGQEYAARALWERAKQWAAKTGAEHLLAEYAAKYAPLRKL
jgi:hypothetical protein